MSNIQFLSGGLPFIVVATIIGLLVGSFLNVVIHRLPIMMQRSWAQECAEYITESTGTAPQNTATEQQYNIAVPRSCCPACGHKITAVENIPVLSYLFLRRRCSACKAPISLRYPLVEILSGALTGFIAWRYGPTLLALMAALFVWAMIALSFIDYDTQLLPDDITLPLIWIGLTFNMLISHTLLADAVIGAIAGYLSLWIVYWLFKFATGKDGMGYGDFKLLAAIGAWLGWQMLPLVILLSSIVGAVAGVSMIAFGGRDKAKPIPFGPYLAVAGVIALFWGTLLNKMYLNTLL